MHAWEQIQLTLDFIEEHLNEDISTEYLAGSPRCLPSITSASSAAW